MGYNVQIKWNISTLSNIHVLFQIISSSFLKYEVKYFN